MAKISFDEIKDELSAVINKKMAAKDIQLGNLEEYHLVPTFGCIATATKVDFNQGGMLSYISSSIPCIYIVGAKSGRLYPFSLKMLLPKIDIGGV